MDDENIRDESEEIEVPETEGTEDAESAEEGRSEDQGGRGVSSDLIRGHINTIILRALYDGDKYGYEIISEIERKSHEQYSLKQPSLYSALKRLEKDGYITSYWGGSVGGGRRKYFSLTDAGKEIAERNQSEWEYSRTIIDSLISDKDFDFNNPAPSAVNMRVLRRTTSRVPSGEEGDEELDFEPVFDDSAERDRLAAEYEQRNSELEERIAEYEKKNSELEERQTEYERQSSEFEEQRADFERRNVELEERRVRLEVQSQEIDARAQAFDEQRNAFQEEREREQTELAEREAQHSETETRLREESERNAAALLEERTRHEQQLAEERRLYEHSLEEANRARSEALEEERLRHEQALAEQDARIREEMEREFQLRERQILHQNYVNLVNTPPAPDPDAPYYVPEQAAPAPAQEQPAPEADYRSVLGRVYSSAVPRSYPAETEAPERAQSLSGIDFADIQTRAAQDGIRVVTTGNQAPARSAEENTVHKGKALFLSAVVVFVFCIILGGITLGVSEQYGISLFLPYFIWCAGLALLLVTGLAYANKFGERSLRRRSPAILNSIVIYALLVIIALIVALAARIDFTASADLANFVVIPVIFSFGVVIFGTVYYLQVREINKK